VPRRLKHCHYAMVAKLLVKDEDVDMALSAQMTHRLGEDVEPVLPPDAERIGVKAIAAGGWQPDEIVWNEIGLAEPVDRPLDDRASPEIDRSCHVLPQSPPDGVGCR